MDDKPKEIWFPAKKYGWGWGLPCSWKGWVVLGVWLILIIALSIVFSPNKSLIKFLVAIGSSTALVLLVCIWKGEKPKWRWGDENGK